MRILVTNDDGVRSEGIHALGRALERLGEVTIVAPHLEASAIGHALTLRRPLRFERLDARRVRSRRHAHRLRQHRNREDTRRASGSRRVRHQPGLQPRRRRDVLRDRRRRAGGRAARVSRVWPSRSNARRTRSISAPPRPPRRTSPRPCSAMDCLHARSSTSTCRPDVRRASA